MKQITEMAFLRLAERLIEAAEAVKCSNKDFYAGLTMIRDRIGGRLLLLAYDGAKKTKEML